MMRSSCKLWLMGSSEQELPVLPCRMQQVQLPCVISEALAPHEIGHWARWRWLGPSGGVKMALAMTGFEGGERDGAQRSDLLPTV